MRARGSPGVHASMIRPTSYAASGSQWRPRLTCTLDRPLLLNLPSCHNAVLTLLTACK